MAEHATRPTTEPTQFDVDGDDMEPLPLHEAAMDRARKQASTTAEQSEREALEEILKACREIRKALDDLKRRVGRPRAGGGKSRAA